MSATRHRRLLEGLAAEAEVRRCKRDKRYFIETYWHIPSEGAPGGRTLFKFWDFQHEAFDALQTEKRVVIAKCRQLGMTTLSMADTGHGLLFADDRYEALVVSWREDIAQATLGMIEFGFQYLPAWMRARLAQRDDRTKERITFRHRDGRTTSAQAFAGTARSGASKTATRVVLDEFALLENPGAVYRAVEPTTLAAMRTDKPGAVFIVLSTARGNRNQFARLFWDGWERKISWKALFFPVTCNRFLADADVDEDGFWSAWDEKRREYAGREHEFFADYPRTPEEAFRESGRSRFSHVPELSDCPPFEFSGFLQRKPNGTPYIDLARDDLDHDASHIHMAFEPQLIDRSRTYVISVDPSLGVGRDYAAAQVRCNVPDEPGVVEIVAYIHRNNIDPAEFADLVDMTGRIFKGDSQRSALVVVERNDNSEGEVIARLRQRRYPSLFRYVAKDRPTERLGAVFGWPINSATKPEAINALARLFGAREDEAGVMVPDPKLRGIYPELRDELVNYVVIEKDNGRIQMKADGNGHDDLVTSTAIGCAVMERLRPRASGKAPTVEEGPRPDGPVALFDPGAYLRREQQIAEQRSREEARAWKNLERQRRKTSKRRRK
jgi:hypothetical protein